MVTNTPSHHLSALFRVVERNNLSGRAQSVIDANQYVMLAEGRFHPNFLQRYKKYIKNAKKAFGIIQKSYFLKKSRHFSHIDSHLIPT